MISSNTADQDSPARFKYVIHQSMRYVETRFLDDLTVGVVLSYLQEVWEGHPEIAGFSELLDIRKVTRIEMNTGQLASIVERGRTLDDSSQRSKIALVVIDPYNFFKGELYKTLQELYPVKNKEVEIFKDRESARQWLLRL